MFKKALVSFISREDLLCSFVLNRGCYSLVKTLSQNKRFVSSHLLGWKSVAASVPVGTVRDRGSQMCHNNFLPQTSRLVAIETHGHIR